MNTSGIANFSQHQEVSLYDIVRLVSGYKKPILSFFVAINLIALALFFILPVSYRYSQQIKLAGYVIPSRAGVVYKPILNANFNFISNVIMPDMASRFPGITVSKKASSGLLPDSVIVLEKRTAVKDSEHGPAVKQQFNNFLLELRARQKSDFDQLQHFLADQKSMYQRQLAWLQTPTQVGQVADTESKAKKASFYLNHSDHQFDARQLPGTYGQRQLAALDLVTQVTNMQAEMATLKLQMSSLQPSHFVSTLHVKRSYRSKWMALVLGFVISCFFSMLLVAFLECRRKLRAETSV